MLLVMRVLSTTIVLLPLMMSYPLDRSNGDELIIGINLLVNSILVIVIEVSLVVV